MRGTIRKLGLEGGLWALITTDGRTVELIDCPAALRQDGAEAEVKGRRDNADVTVGMVGDAVYVTSYKLLK